MEKNTGLSPVFFSFLLLSTSRKQSSGEINITIRVKIIFGIVFAAWLLVMAVFYQCEIRPSRIRGEVLLPRMGEGFFSLIREEWMGIYYQGRQMGFSHSLLAPHREEGFYGSALKNTLWLEIPVRGGRTRLSSHTSCLIETGGKIRSLNLDIHNSRPRLELKGRIERGILLISLQTDLGKHDFFLPLPRPSLPFYALAPFLPRQDLKQGQVFTLPALDPLKSLTGGEPEMGEIRFQVVDRDKNGYHLTASYLGMAIDIYLDKKGEIAKIDTPLGWKLERQSHNQVMDFLKGRGSNINDETQKPLPTAYSLLPI